MPPVFQAVTPAIIDRLTAIVGAEQISAAQADLDQHAHDQGFYPAHAAEVVVWPTSAEQVSQVLALANAQQIPVTAWGAGTSIKPTRSRFTAGSCCRSSVWMRSSPFTPTIFRSRCSPASATRI